MVKFINVEIYKLYLPVKEIPNGKLYVCVFGFTSLRKMSSYIQIIGD